MRLPVQSQSQAAWIVEQALQQAAEQGDELKLHLLRFEALLAGRTSRQKQGSQKALKLQNHIATKLVHPSADRSMPPPPFTLTIPRGHVGYMLSVTPILHTPTVTHHWRRSLDPWGTLQGTSSHGAGINMTTVD